MTVTLSWEAVSACAAVAALLIGMIGYLIRRTAELKDKMIKRIDDLDDGLGAHRLEDVRDHAAVHAQVADFTSTVAQNYVSVPVFERGMRELNTTLTEIRKEIGAFQIESRKDVAAVHGRIDQLIRDGSDRRAGR